MFSLQLLHVDFYCIEVEVNCPVEVETWERIYTNKCCYYQETSEYSKAQKDCWTWLRVLKRRQRPRNGNHRREPSVEGNLVERKVAMWWWRCEVLREKCSISWRVSWCMKLVRQDRRDISRSYIEYYIEIMRTVERFRTCRVLWPTCYSSCRRLLPKF